MKRVNFNIKDRKLLYIFLSIIVISIFTLSIAYAALSVTLNISGNTEVVASSWDVHFDNIVYTGSETIPSINGSTISFNTVLNEPGDKYFFTVDIVNGGSIDAIIEKINKTPDLTDDQKKYLNYNIEYVNGNSIAESHVLEAGDFVRIKVLVEYKSDISASDLPSSQTVINLSFTMDYIQKDVDGITVNSHGIPSYDLITYVEGNVGTELCLGTECFYVLSGVEENDVYLDLLLFSKYNLDIGNEVSYYDGVFDSTNYVTKPLVNATGIQNSNALGVNTSDGSTYNFPYYGTVPFSTSKHWEDSPTYDDLVTNNSYLTGVLRNYSNYLVESGYDIRQIGVPNAELLTSLGCSMDGCNYKWLSSTSYWLSTVYSGEYLMAIKKDSEVGYAKYNTEYLYGIRPWIIYRSYK